MKPRVSDEKMAALAHGAERSERHPWPSVGNLIADILDARANITALESALTLLHDEMQIANTAGKDIPHDKLWSLMQIARRINLYREQAGDGGGGNRAGDSGRTPLASPAISEQAPQ